jgi:hypothetical protein
MLRLVSGGFRDGYRDCHRRRGQDADGNERVGEGRIQALPQRRQRQCSRYLCLEGWQAGVDHVRIDQAAPESGSVERLKAVAGRVHGKM